MSFLVVVDSIVVILYIMFGTFGNILIIAAAILRPKLRTPPNLFIVNVAVTDLVMASYGMSSVLAHVVSSTSEEFNQSVCIITGMTIVISCGVSLLSLCLIAFNRYMSVCQFSSYNHVFSRRNLLLMIGGIWIFSLLVVVISYVSGLCGYRYDPAQVTCTYNNEDHGCTYLFIVVGIVIPSIFASVFYLLIYRKLQETSKRLHNHSANSGQKKQRKSRKEVRTIVMMFTAFALFVVVWFPYGIVIIIDGYIPQHPLLVKIVTWLAFSNCGINWIVYGAMNRNFRSGYRDVIMGCRKQVGSSGSNNTDDSTPKPGQDGNQSDGTITERAPPTGLTRVGENNNSRSNAYRPSNGDYHRWEDV